MILASQSPRRIELMTEAGYDVTVMPADIDETRLPDEDPASLVARLAEQKAAAVAVLADPGETVVAADTIVATEREILGKPVDEDDAFAMLRSLSGRVHQVMTGVHLLRVLEDGSYRHIAFVDETDVEFYDLSDEEIDAYIATGEPLDKAGAYGIQGEGGRLLVRALYGDYYNVVGLPIAKVVRALDALDRFAHIDENPSTDEPEPEPAADADDANTAAPAEEGPVEAEGAIVDEDSPTDEDAAALDPAADENADADAPADATVTDMPALDESSATRAIDAGDVDMDETGPAAAIDPTVAIEGPSAEDATDRKTIR